MKHMIEIGLFVLANVLCLLVAIASAALIVGIIYETVQYAQEDASSLMLMIPLSICTIYIFGRYIVKIATVYRDLYNIYK